MKMMPQLRQNIVTGEWVVIAPERAKRPSDFVVKPKPNPQREDVSPFAVGGKAWEHRIKDADTKYTYTVPNLYPAFVCDEKLCETRSYYPEHSFFRAKAAVGDHDIVVIKDPTLDVYSFPPAVWEDLLLAFQVRYLVHQRNSAVEHIMPIYNHGAESGASIRHPHAQIFAAPIVPNYIQKELTGAERYYDNNGVNVFADLLAHEKEEKVRVLAASDDFLAFTFYAARFPFEIWIVPQADQSHFAAAKKAQRQSLAKILRKIFAMIDKVLKKPAINFWIHSLPTTLDQADYYRWHLEIAPRVTGYGGFELGSGLIIDVMSPEKAAEYLRDAS